jgi:exodeoxyribonuclease III
MKIITWNCNMAYRKKASLILEHKPDIVIVPECEHPDKLKFESNVPLPKDIFWFGRNQNKGLGVFSYSNYKFQLEKIHNPDFCTVLPLKVTNGKFGFTLFAIWANNPQDKGYEYVGQVWKAINFYSELIKNKRTILTGDFNSNTIWDKPRREGNHSTVVDFLAKKGIHSTYHKFFNQTQGQEEHNTLFMYRHKDKPYHIDYCFASDDFVKRIDKVEVGLHNDWYRYSDHTPLIVTFNI